MAKSASCKANARPSALATGWGCYPMIPWAGRLLQGRIPVDGGAARLEQNRPPSSIHGLVFDKPWQVVSQTQTAMTMSCELRGLGWPFGGDARQTLRLSPTHLDLELDVGGYTRAGPAGVGWHPWFARPKTGDVAIRVDAREVLVLDADLIPTGERRAVTAVEDLRTRPVLGDRRLDHVYVNSRGPALVTWPDLDLAIEFDDSLPTTVVHTPAHGFCVEPQTMWPNAPLLAAEGVGGTGLCMLAPGERLRASHRWRWTPRDGAITSHYRRWRTEDRNGATASSPTCPGRSDSVVPTLPIRCRSRSTNLTASCSASAWRTTCASRSACGTPLTGQGPTCFGVGTFDRPWLAAGMPTETAPRRRSTRPSSSSRRWAFRSSRSTIATSRPKAPPTPRRARTSSRASRASRSTWPARAPSFSGERRISSAIRVTQPVRRRTPTPRSSRTPPRRSRRCSR